MTNTIRLGLISSSSAIVTAAALACLLAVGWAGILTPRGSAGEADAAARDDERPVIDIEHKGPIKVVFQVTTAEMKDGVGKGLFYVDKVYNSYLKAGIDPKQLDLRAVFHGEGAEHLLTDAAWNRLKHESTGNPSTALITEMVKNGVHVELCDSRRISNGWAKSDVHPGVELVRNAFHRIIDLQMSGYSYIRF